jgi:hypothetical protein
LAKPGIHGAEQINVEHAPRAQMEHDTPDPSNLRLRVCAVMSAGVEPDESNQDKGEA